MTNFNIEVQKCVEILNNGGIILYPTDTIYGIGSDSHNNEAINSCLLYTSPSPRD